ncbi:hypothetical protein [Ureibacillus chungkukjangi]|uniref:Lipoprotein n=1 Tax=Ureibacillus chungkukjangi TaxID=1202712 RepID=A0A318TVQ0_9BACL|nr:hypothetical protein [Ureibacillus chungkukjangi]PYF07950.1 hypothetical protein BJ095_103118 [Ureibacillus chungkukjangi]HCG4535913.1 hypothetical protein [Salmonella enterica subsp. enterica serovar Typhi str. AG3]
MKRLSLFLSLFAFVFLVGCSEKDSKKETTTEEPVVTDEPTTTEEETETETETEPSNPDLDLAMEFTNYIDQIILLAPEEDRIISLYDSVTGVNYVNDEILYYTLLDDVLPSYRQFVVDLESIMPKNSRIQELHELYIEGANTQYNAFTLMVSAIEKQDMDTMTQANQGLDQARALLRDWLYEVDAISIETGVSIQ